MLTDHEFGEKTLGLKAIVLNLTLIFRRVRKGEVAFEPSGLQYYEDGLVEAGAELAAVASEHDARWRAAIGLLDKMAGVLRRNLPEQVTGFDLIELGEIRDGLIALNQARGIVPGEGAAGQLPYKIRDVAPIAPVLTEDQLPECPFVDETTSKPALRELPPGVIDFMRAAPRKGGAA